MPREYKIKINVDASAAIEAINKFDEQARAVFDKLNKTSFKPEAFINGINISINKVMEFAAKQDAATAKIAQANAKVEQAYQKTAQVAIAANAKVEAEQAKAAAAAEKAAAQRQAAAEKTAQAEINANAKVTQSQNKLTSDLAKAETQRQAAYLRSADVAQKSQAQIVSATEKTVQTQINSTTKLTSERIKAENTAQQLDREREASTKQAESAVVSGNDKMAQSYQKFANAATSAWNQIKMVIGFSGVASMFRSALTEMKAMSDEMVTYQKVTGATAAEMEKVRASAYQSAKQYAQAPSDYLSSVAMMARAGYGAKSEQMANLATKTQLVGDMSAEAASKFLIAVDAGYQMGGSIERLSEVLNAANVADNNYATSLAQIAEGMTLIAPLANSMNVSVEETTAAIGTMQALTQRSGTEVARAFRMIAINIAKDTETEVEEGFKLTQENVEDFNALLKEFAADELKAAENAGKLLNPMKAIGALAKAWKSGTLNEQQLFNVLETIGGARYTNNIMALVKNFDMYEEMLNKFTTELTSADDEVTAMTNSWSAKFENLKTAWTEMVNDAISENFIKNLLDLGTGFLNFTGNIENFIMVAGGAVAVIKTLLTIMSSGLSAINPWIAAFGLLATAIGIASSAIDAHKQKLVEASQAAAENAQKAYEQAKAINELTAAYNALSEDGQIDNTELEEAKRIQSEINKLVADLPEKYDLVNGSIEANRKNLAALNEEQYQAARLAAENAFAQAKMALTDYAFENRFGNNWGDARRALGFNISFGLFGSQKQEVTAAYLNKFFGEDSDFLFTRDTGVTAFGAPQGKLLYRGNQDAETLIKNYELLEKLQNSLVEDIKETPELEPLYKAVTAELNEFETQVDAYRTTKETLDNINNRDLSKGTGSRAQDATDGGTASTANKNATAIDAYAQSYNRLQAAISAAAAAQETFNQETSTTKADGLNVYASAMKAYQEEVAAGRYNSTRMHAAAKALLGEKGYEATGGYVQNVMAALSGDNGGLMSLEQAITTLTAEYKDAKGNVVEGYGAVKLLDKLNELGNFGWNLWDENGNFSLKMTEQMYQQVAQALPGFGVELLQNALNALDQYDINGRNTSIAPKAAQSDAELALQASKENTTALEETKEKVDESNELQKVNIEKTEQNTEETEKETKATEENTVFTEDNTAKTSENTTATQIAGNQVETAGNQVAEAVSGFIGEVNTLASGLATPIAAVAAAIAGYTSALFGDDANKPNVSVTDKAPVISEAGKATEGEFRVPVILKHWGNGIIRGLGNLRAAPNVPSSSAPYQEEEQSYIATHQEEVAAAQERALAKKAAKTSEREQRESEAAADEAKRQSDLAARKTFALEKDAEEREEQAAIQNETNRALEQQAKRDAEAKKAAQEAERANAEKAAAIARRENIESRGAAGEAYVRELQATKRAAAEKAAEEAKQAEIAKKAAKTAEREQRESEAAADEAQNTEHARTEAEAKRKQSVQATAEAEEEMSFLAVFQAEQAKKESQQQQAAQEKAQNQWGEALTVTGAHKSSQGKTNIFAGQERYTVQPVEGSDYGQIITLEPHVDEAGASEAQRQINTLAEPRMVKVETEVEEQSEQQTVQTLDGVSDAKRVAEVQVKIDTGDIQSALESFKELTSDEQSVVIETLVNRGDYKNAQSLLNGLTEEQQKQITISVSGAAEASSAFASLTADEIKNIYINIIETHTITTYENVVTTHTGSGGLSARAVGTQSHPGGPARVNDGTGAELIVDSRGAFIANGGRETIIDLERGAKVYTAEETRQLVGNVPHYAMASMEDTGGGTKSTATAAFDAMTIPVVATTTSKKSSGGSKKKKTTPSADSGGGSVITGGGGGPGPGDDEAWKNLQTLIEYILKRMNKALDAQEEIIDKQIAELNERKARDQEQSKLEELQKSVIDAQKDLYDAETNRTVRYLDENGQWHWRADEKKVQQAREAMVTSQDNLQDYLNDLLIDAQIRALEKEKERLEEEYNSYSDMWQDILDAVETPQGVLEELFATLAVRGNGAQQNGADAVRNLLLTAMSGGSFGENYTEALSQIALAKDNNPSVPGVSDAALAALIASSGTNVSQGTLSEALQSLAGGGTKAYGNAGVEQNINQGTYYYINGVQIGEDMAELPLSEVLSRLSVYNNILY